MATEVTRHAFVSVRVGLAVLLLALAVALALPGAAWARSVIDADAVCSLSVENAPADARGGVAFSLYKVADVNDISDVYTPCRAFAGYAVNLHPDDDAGWRALGQTLSAYVARDRIAPSAEAVSDMSGRASFDGLSVGLYLLVGHAAESDSTAYSIEPVLVQLPDLDTSTGADVWVYDASVVLKWDTDVFSELSALKVWSGDDAASRPASVEVQLLRDGEVVASEVLSAANSWSFTWRALDPSFEWQVVEASVPDGYTVSLSREGGVVTLVNAVDTPPMSATGEKLPQTGMLWWPVPLLAVAGLTLVIAGAARRRGSKE